jgi:hypothetical protein
MLIGTKVAALAQIQHAIGSSGRLSAKRPDFEHHTAALHGSTKTTAVASAVAARLAKAGKALPKSTLQTVDGQPDGFGKQVLWDEHDAGLALVVFLNAADHLGVMISGAREHDTVEIVSATGIASFAEETRNEGIASLIGVVGVGADLLATAFGAPEAKPVIDAGVKYAQDQFKEEKVKTKRRDAYGVDPGSGHRARQEGGVIISLPAAGQIFYSGNDDHKERWIKEPGTRDPAHYPAHVHDAFFLQGHGKDKRTCTDEGDIIVTAWDAKFEDNFGYYRLHMLLKRGR